MPTGSRDMGGTQAGHLPLCTGGRRGEGTGPHLASPGQGVPVQDNSGRGAAGGGG